MQQRAGSTYLCQAAEGRQSFRQQRAGSTSCSRELAILLAAEGRQYIQQQQVGSTVLQAGFSSVDRVLHLQAGISEVNRVHHLQAGFQFRDRVWTRIYSINGYGIE